MLDTSPDRRPNYGVTGAGRLALAYNRLDASAVPNVVLMRLAAAIDAISTQYPPQPTQPRRCPLVGRLAV